MPTNTLRQQCVESYKCRKDYDKWKQDSTGWQYVRNDGTVVRDDWINAPETGEYYHFDSNGYMQTGIVNMDTSLFIGVSEGESGFETMIDYTSEELTEALRAINSIIGKCEKAQEKFLEGNAHHTLLRNRLKAMYISKALIIDALSKK